MSTAPAPQLKGIFCNVKTGVLYYTFLLKHHADAGETPEDDCMITNSISHDGGAHGCGESGLWPLGDFNNLFRFVRSASGGSKQGGGANG